MKQFITLIFSILLSLNFAFAQEEGKKEVKYTNPFEQAGIKNVKIATLSQGKYQEFHDLDSVVQIGTTLINVNSRKIVGYVANDSTNVMPSPTLISRWVSVDPLAERHYNHSPYIFSANNPINNVDPDGRDWYAVKDQNGNNTAVIWREGDATSIDIDGVAYANIGTTYERTLSDGSLIVYNQNEVISINDGINPNTSVGDAMNNSAAILNAFAGFDISIQQERGNREINQEIKNFALSWVGLDDGTGTVAPSLLGGKVGKVSKASKALGVQYKKPKKGISGKEGAKDVPSWARGNKPMVGENGDQFARRLLNKQYGEGNYKTTTQSEYSKIKKWGDRSFE